MVFRSFIVISNSDRVVAYKGPQSSMKIQSLFGGWVTVEITNYQEIIEKARMQHAE